MKVKVAYQAKTADGKVIESNNAFEFKLGSHKVIGGFQKAVQQMKVGETRTILLQPHEAYGTHDPNKVLRIASHEIPKSLNLKPNAHVEISAADGPKIARVRRITQNFVELDANHPLAGQKVIYIITRKA